MSNKKLPSIAVVLDGDATNLERNLDKNVIGRIEDDNYARFKKCFKKRYK